MAHRPDARPGMRVPGIVYADEALMAAIRPDGSLEPVANAATLPGIVTWPLHRRRAGRAGHRGPGGRPGVPGRGDAGAYKDVKGVVHVVEGAGLSRVVARLRPLGVVKG